MDFCFKKQRKTRKDFFSLPDLVGCCRSFQGDFVGSSTMPGFFPPPIQRITRIKTRLRGETTHTIATQTIRKTLFCWTHVAVHCLY